MISGFFDIGPYISRISCSWTIKLNVTIDTCQKLCHGIATAPFKLVFSVSKFYQNSSVTPKVSEILHNLMLKSITKIRIASKIRNWKKLTRNHAFFLFLLPLTPFWQFNKYVMRKSETRLGFKSFENHEHIKSNINSKYIETLKRFEELDWRSLKIFEQFD